MNRYETTENYHVNKHKTKICLNVTIKLSIYSRSCIYDIHNRCSKCPPFAATQAREASLQEEDRDCGGVAAAHYGGVRTPRPVCH